MLYVQNERELYIMNMQKVKREQMIVWQSAFGELRMRGTAN